MSRFAPISLFLTILFLTVPFIGIAQVNQPPVTEARLAEASLKLLQLLHDRRPISDLGKIKDMSRAAEDRLSLMRVAAQSDPALALEYVLEKSVRNLFPLQVRNQIEERKIISGRLETAYVENFDTGFEKSYRFIDVPGLGMLELFSVDNSTSVLPARSIVSLDVYSFGHFVLLSPTESDNKANVISKAPLVPAPVTPLAGYKKMAVLLLRFSGQSVSDFHRTPAQIDKMMFSDQDSINAYYRESSFGKFGLTGRVFGPYSDITLDLSPEEMSCNSQSSLAGFDTTKYWTKKGNEIIENFSKHDQSINDFDYYLIVLPANCDMYHGWALVGSNFAFVDSASFDKKIGYYAATHEFGHLLGLGHASSMNISSPVVEEYGDAFSVMGRPKKFWNYTDDRPRQLNNFHKANLNWINASIIQTITTDGVYTIVPSNAPCCFNQTSIYRIPIASPSEQKDRISLPKTFLYLEYRQPSGYFDDFSLDDPAVKGISLRVAGVPDSALPKTFFIDLYSRAETAFILPGKSYCYEADKIRIDVLSSDHSGAKFQVTFNSKCRVEEDVPRLIILSPAPSSDENRSRQITGTFPLRVGFSPLTLRVKEIQLLIDGKLERRSAFLPKSPWEVGLKTWKLSPGEHSIGFRAEVDSLSLRSEIVPVDILPDTTPPIVEITNPPTGATTLPVDTGWVTVSARAKDPTGISSFAICVNDSCTTNFWGCQTTTGSAYVGCSLRVPVSQLTNQSAKVAVLAYDRAYNPNRGAVGIVFPPPVKVEVDQNNSGIVVFGPLGP